MSKNLEMSYLLDFYGEVLTDKQRDMMQQYFNMDLSLSEINDFEICAYHTPGHSKGSMCYKIGDNLFSGDTLFNGTVGRWDFEGGSFEELMTSIGFIVDNFDENINVFPGHGDSTTIANELLYNPYLNKNKKR